ncbi:unnamed protein product [Prorocentrum cordatum]|uniref:Subtilisin n=1 Tax=Prorocentrum cordatum TaxID=2364126 RepID=A0ABN9SFU3_9DINO|nr:unnamed protein product [Polarella glacialis]
MERGSSGLSFINTKSATNNLPNKSSAGILSDKWWPERSLDVTHRSNGTSSTTAPIAAFVVARSATLPSAASNASTMPLPTSAADASCRRKESVTLVSMYCGVDRLYFDMAQ